jgi:hypothetical protein
MLEAAQLEAPEVSDRRSEHTTSPGLRLASTLLFHTPPSEPSTTPSYSGQTTPIGTGKVIPEVSFK